MESISQEPMNLTEAVADGRRWVEMIQGLCHQLSRIGDSLEKMADQRGEALKPAYSVKEAAQMLGKSEPTIRRWIREGKLASAKSSDSPQGQHLIPRHSIEKYLSNG